MSRDKHDFESQGPQYPFHPPSEPHTDAHRPTKDHTTEGNMSPHDYPDEPITEGHHQQTEEAFSPEIQSFSTVEHGIDVQEPRTYSDIPYEEVLAMIQSNLPSSKRAAAVRTLGLFEQHDSRRVLLTALMNDDKRVRVAALEACTMLAHQIPPAIVEVALTDRSWFVRASAMWALSYFGDRAPIKRIVALADDEEESIQVRYWALYTLGELHDKDSARRFLQLLNNRNTDEQLREIAAIALGRVGPLDDKLSDLAITILRDRVRSRREVAAVRVAAAHALAQRSQVPDDETLSILRTALADENREVRQAVELALDTMIEQLVTALHQPAKPGHIQLMNVLCKLHDRVPERAFENLLSHTDVAVRQAALQILNTPDKELLPPTQPFAYMSAKHKQHRIKLQGVQGKTIGAGHFYQLTPLDLKEAILPQALDGGWIPRSLLHLIMSKGANKKFSYSDISPYLNKQIRTEYIRSLVHSRSVVIPVSLLYSIPTLFNDFLSQRANREAFKWLLGAGAILPLLTDETSPDQPSTFTPSTNGFAAWQRVCWEVRMLCVRLSWDESSYQNIENHRLKEFQKDIVRTVPTPTTTHPDKNTHTATGLAKRLQEAIHEIRVVTPIQLLEGLYERFLLVEGSRAREHFYDGAKLYAQPVKELADLTYNKNLADTLHSGLLIPGDTSSLTVVQAWREGQPTYKGHSLLPRIMKLLTPGIFPGVRTGRYLKSLRLLSLQDIVELRSTHSWNIYIDEVQRLHKSTPADLDQRLVAVHQRYTDLAAYITGMLDGRVPEHQHTEVYANWTPTPTLQLHIASAFLFISWSADDAFYHFSSNEPETDAQGAAAFSVRFSIGEWQQERPTHDLAMSFDFMHGMVDDAKSTWNTLKEQLQKHLTAVQLKQVSPLKTGPELSY